MPQVGAFKKNPQLRDIYQVLHIRYLAWYRYDTYYTGITIIFKYRNLLGNPHNKLTRSKL
jgi:hypothetical protein